jgi:hypothetical protein
MVWEDLRKCKLDEEHGAMAAKYLKKSNQ